MQHEFENPGAIVRQDFLERVDLVVARFDFILVRELAHPADQHVLVMRAVEDADEAAARGCRTRREIGRRRIWPSRYPSRSLNSGCRLMKAATNEQRGTTLRPWARAISSTPRVSRDAMPWPLRAAGTSVWVKVITPGARL